MNTEFVIGVDVGTGSVRAGIFTLKGKMVAFAQREITIWKPETDFVEQSSENIWRAAAESVKEAVTEAYIKPEQIVGIAFRRGPRPGNPSRLDLLASPCHTPCPASRATPGFL